MELLDLTITEAHNGLKKKEFSSRELTQAYLNQIKKTDDDIGAYLSVTEELATSQAEKADEIISNGGNFPILTGIPCSIKDIILKTLIAG